MQLRVFAELSEDRERIEVHFRYDRALVERIKSVPGKRFVPRDKGGPYWTVPATLLSGKRLRETFGEGLVLGDAVKAWGREQVQLEGNLRALHTAEDAELERVPERIALAIAGEVVPGLPKPFNQKRDARPYQRADIKMMSMANVLNANQPGTGKTLEYIGSIYEAGLEDGPHLVCAPVRSLENVWAMEFNRFTDMPVYTAEQPAKRTSIIKGFLNWHQMEEGKVPGCVVAVNPDMLRLEKYWDAKRDADKPLVEDALHARKDYKGNAYRYRSPEQRALFAINWRTFVVDEFHKAGQSRLSLFMQGAQLIKAERIHFMSGTPMGGKVRKLWPTLNVIGPEEYKSEWAWIDAWLEVDDNGYGKTVGGILPGREDDFYAHHSKHLVRRLKRDALPGLPAKVFIDVECGMTTKQAKEYRAFAADAEAAIEGGMIATNNILAEYTRLKQLANARCEVREDGTIHPTMDSGKLPQLLEKLDAEGIRKTDPEPGARAIVATESKRFANVVAAYLRAEGLACDLLTGDTKDSKPIISRFKDETEEPYVIVMTTDTGGVSLNLEEAGSVHVLDEKWNPDDQEQLEDRGDRGSRTTPLRCYYYRTKGTIQEYVQDVCEGKKLTNGNVLDARRKGLRAA